jgi:hypothetical protein
MTIPESTTAPTGGDLVVRWILDREHYNQAHKCPVDGEDTLSTTLVKLAYVFRTCNCGTPDYAHLVEQLYHLKCLTSFRGAAEETQDLLR